MALIQPFNAHHRVLTDLFQLFLRVVRYRLMSLNLPSNPGVGFKLTAPRIPDRASSSSGSPGPQYSISGTGIPWDLTERQKSQNLLLSKRYEGKAAFSFSSSSSAGDTTKTTTTTMQARGNSFAVDPKGDNHAPSAVPVGPPSDAPTSSGKKRPREQDDAAPADYYNVPGMAALMEREMNQNDLLSKRYHRKE